MSHQEIDQLKVIQQVDSRLLTQKETAVRLRLTVRQVKREEARKSAEEQELARQRERRNKIENKRREGLINAAGILETSRQIRNLISHIELSDSKTEDIESWLVWAKGVADELDPINRLEKLLNEHEKLENTSDYYL